MTSEPVVVLIGCPDLAEAVGAALTSSAVVRRPYPRTRDELPEWMTGADLVIAADDGSLPVLHQWVNTIGLRLDVPALHVEVRGAQATVGPLVRRGGAPCFLCWRMRALACADDFAAAMAREEELDARRVPEAAPEPVLPALLPVVARELLAVQSRRLTGRVLTLDASGRKELHLVLPRPDCPACSTEKRLPIQAAQGDAEGAVDRLCGVVRRLDVIPKDATEPERPFIVRAELANSLFRAGDRAFVSCSGKGWTEEEARNSALGEALERYAAMTWQPARRITSTYDDLHRPTLHPRDLVLYADHQYGAVPYPPWRPETKLDWVPANSLVTGDEVWIPLLATHLGYLPSAEAALFPATSTGFAAWPDLAGATLRALLEVIERDAFAIAWSHRLPGRCVPAVDVPDDRTRAIAALYARRGVEVVVHLLPTDTVAAVALAVMWSDQAPAAVIGVGADLDPVAAARSAVLEAGQVRPMLGRSLRDPAVRARMVELAAEPSKVASVDDHDLLYADQQAAATGMRFLRDAERQPWPDTAPLVAQGNLAELIRSLAAVAPDVLAVDITPPDVAGLGVRVVRGVVPGFVPIWFGADRARLGGRRLLEMPSRIGLRPEPAQVHELNPDPHPLA